MWFNYPPVSRCTPSASRISTPLSWSLPEAAQEAFPPQPTSPRARLIVAQASRWVAAASWADRHLESFPETGSTLTTISACALIVESAQYETRNRRRDGETAIAAVDALDEWSWEGAVVYSGVGLVIYWLPVWLRARGSMHRPRKCDYCRCIN